jgi:hypothetical protein
MESIMATNKELEKIINELVVRVEALETRLAPRKQSSLHKTEQAGEGEAPEIREDRGHLMNDKFKLQSMKNAIVILPVKNLVNGKHSVADIKAICGFWPTDELMDQLYPTEEKELKEA